MPTTYISAGFGLLSPTVPKNFIRSDQETIDFMTFSNSSRYKMVRAIVIALISTEDFQTSITRHPKVDEES